VGPARPRGLSTVVPVCNSATTIEALIDRIAVAAEALGRPFEVILDVFLRWGTNKFAAVEVAHHARADGWMTNGKAKNHTRSGTRARTKGRTRIGGTDDQAPTRRHHPATAAIHHR